MGDVLRKYKPSGALFQQKGNKGIDYSGKLEISDEVFEDLVAQYKTIVTGKQSTIWLKFS